MTSEGSDSAAEAAEAAGRLDRRLRSLDAQMAGRKERKVLRKMLRALKDLPHLWDRAHPDYNNQDKLKDLYLLLNMYRKYDPFATLCNVRRKVETLMSLYVLEWQRVQHARSFQPDEPHTHQPTMWHYNDLGFLDTDIKAKFCTGGEPGKGVKQNTADKSTNTTPTGHQDISTSTTLDTKPTYVFTTDMVTCISTDKKVKVKSVYEPYVNPKNLDDSVEIFVESELKVIDKKQKEIARKIVADTLKKAKLGSLTEDSCDQQEKKEDVILPAE